MGMAAADDPPDPRSDPLEARKDGEGPEIRPLHWVEDASKPVPQTRFVGLIGVAIFVLIAILIVAAVWFEMQALAGR